MTVWRSFLNIVKCPGLKKLFNMLFSQFNVSLWLKMAIGVLKPLLAYILPEGILPRLSFVYNKKDLFSDYQFSWSYKLLSTLYSKL